MAGLQIVAPSVVNAAPGRQVVLATNGRPRATIVVPKNATGFESQAADELRHHVELIAGATLPRTEVGGKSRTPITIYIGRACPDPVSFVPGFDGESDAFRLQITDDTIQLASNPGSRGVLNAAYELLEQAGVQWLIPGPSGTAVPPGKIAKVSVQDESVIPAYESRILQPTRYNGAMPEGVDPLEAAAWMRRNRLAGSLLGRHGIPMLPPADKATEPELFMHDTDGRVLNQLDVSHPEVLRRAIAAARELLAGEPDTKYLSMGPVDGLGFGESEWDAGDIDPLGGILSVTDRYVKFYNLILEDIQADYPDVGIAFYAYIALDRPPVREIPNPRLLPLFAPILVDRVHSMGDRDGYERRYFKRQVERWRDLGLQWGYRGYSYNLADPGVPFSPLPQIAEEHPLLRELGASISIRIEGLHSWGHDAPGYYLLAKLMWDPTLVVEPIVDEFFDASYGPSANDMRRYFSRLESAISSAAITAGNIYDFPAILDEDLIDKLDADLADAESTARDSGRADVSDRILITRKAFEFGRHLLDAIRAWRSFEFAEAKRLYDLAVGLADEAAASSPVAIYPNRRNYLGRFWGDQMNQAAELTEGGREIVARLPQEWMILLDSNDVASNDEVWAAGVDTRTWRSADTVEKSWTRQGLRYYKGTAWYQCKVHVPDEYRDRELFLWLGTVDETARAWVNGHELEVTRGGGSLKPQEFNATGRVVAGDVNEITIKVANASLNEIGTGGIMGPSLLWAGGNVSADDVRLMPRKRLVEPIRLSQPKVQKSPPDAEWMAQLPDMWKAYADPYGKAVSELGLWEAGLSTDGWLDVDVVNSPLEEQGFAYYRGGMAYRMTTLPASVDDLDGCRLWIAGAYGEVRVWANDEELTVVGAGNMGTPWEFDLSGTPVREDSNAIVISATGSFDGDRPGSITGPVYIYKPS
ncbi:DUF4838 domain-containing protein [Phytoactinopolyspora limicola]|uniref:DUF4838 domain-containing protein n=1 Tax=Phytoactinopolyspora limicola TaxID=2715536 RepID=UPI001407F9B9|nr:DUF4838 domain-containing protein [Phytoactinopolyspora limicola]